MPNAVTVINNIAGSDWNIKRAQKPPKNFLSLWAASKLWQIYTRDQCNDYTLSAASKTGARRIQKCSTTHINTRRARVYPNLTITSLAKCEKIGCFSAENAMPVQFPVVKGKEVSFIGYLPVYGGNQMSQTACEDKFWAPAGCIWPWK